MWASGTKVSGNGAAVGFDSKCKGYLAPNTAMASATWTKMVPYSAVYDTLGELDIDTNYRFDVAADGFYRVVAAIGVKYLGLNEGPLAAIYINGAKQYIETGKNVITGLNDTFAMVACSFELSAGDYIEIYGYHKNAGSLNSVAGGWLTVERFA